MIRDKRNPPTSIICPRCKRLINADNHSCPHCGLRRPLKTHSVYQFFGGNNMSFVKIIITLNVIFFIISYLLPLLLPGHQVQLRGGFLGILPRPSSVALHLLGWADPNQILGGRWWLLITATFLHGGILHIFFNMMWVRDLGPVTEQLFSPHKMVLIYLLAGIAGNLLAVVNPYILALVSIQIPQAPVIGASGAVFGLIGAIIAFGKKVGGFYGRNLVRQLGFWAAALIIMGFLIPGISNAAHIGGFIAGFGIGYLLPTRKQSRYEILILAGSALLILATLFSYIMILINFVQVMISLY